MWLKFNSVFLGVVFELSVGTKSRLIDLNLCDRTTTKFSVTPGMYEMLQLSIEARGRRGTKNLDDRDGSFLFE